MRRLLRPALLLLGLVVLVFTLVELSPGDASDHFLGPQGETSAQAQVMAHRGLDQPSPVRLGQTLVRLARLDLGRSLIHDRPVIDLIAEALPHTLLLSGTALLLSFGLGLALGLLQAARRESRALTALSDGLLLLYSLPTFWVALLLMLLFSLRLGWLPTAGMTSARGQGGGLLDVLRHLLLPATALTLTHIAAPARHLSAALLPALDSPHALAARARGLSERHILLRHALRESLRPVIVLAGLSLPALFGGTVLVETVFGWPGMGRLILQAIFRQDTPVVVACVLAYGVLVIAGGALARALASRVDPR